MNSSSGQSASEIDVPAPGLLILTGASHTGKTSVAEEILGIVRAPAAFLSVDEVLFKTLARPSGDAWAEIPLAYELLRPQVKTLLGEGWFVIFESTFTYVPESGPPEFHEEALRQLVAVAEQGRIPWTLVQLSAAESEVASRAADTGRLPHEIVSRTVDLHEVAALPGEPLRLDSTSRPPAELASRALAAFDRA